MTTRKLVRDKIPGLITEQGGTVKIEQVEDEDLFFELLLEKLKEEVAEYLESEEDMELVDILEVVYELAATGGLTRDVLEQMRLAKQTERGGFKQRLVAVF